MNVRNDTATTVCGICGTGFTPVGRQQWCSDTCRQTAWRRRTRVAPPTVPANPNIVYECPECEARYLNERRCADCNTFCYNIGPGGPCPHCDDLVTISELTNTPSEPARLQSP